MSARRLVRFEINFGHLTIYDPERAHRGRIFRERDEDVVGVVAAERMSDGLMRRMMSMIASNATNPSERLIDRLSRTNNNAEFLATLSKSEV